MNIPELIHDNYTKSTQAYLLNYSLKDISVLEELISFFEQKDKILIQRSSNILLSIAEKHPESLKSHRKELLEILFRHPLNDTVIRNVLRLFQHLSVPEDYRGKVIDYCFRKLESPSAAIAIKVFSMTVVYNEIKNNTDLLIGLSTVLEDQYEYGSAGFKARARKILKKIEKDLLENAG